MARPSTKRQASPDPQVASPGEKEPASGAGRSGYLLRGVQGRLINDLAGAIVSGRFKPGETLPREAELMTTYNASRTSVREALKVLAAKGLVETRQKIGTLVRDPELWNAFDSDVLAWLRNIGQGKQMLQDMIELRQVVEPAAARLAAGRATIDDLNRIEKACAAMRAAVSQSTSYATADVEFHKAVFAATHNALLRSFSHIVGDFLRLSFKIQEEGLREADNRAEDVLNHQAIFNAINRGDGAAASEAMLTVILNGKSSLLAALQ